MAEEIKRICTPVPYGAVIDYDEQTILIRREWGENCQPKDKDGYGSYLGIHIATLEHQGNNPCVSKAQAEANAEFIVKACNNHDELVEALKGVLKWALFSVANGNEGSDVLPRGYNKWQALITKTEGRG